MRRDELSELAENYDEIAYELQGILEAIEIRTGYPYDELYKEVMYLVDERR